MAQYAHIYCDPGTNDSDFFAHQFRTLTGLNLIQFEDVGEPYYGFFDEAVILYVRKNYFVDGEFYTNGFPFDIQIRTTGRLVKDRSEIPVATHGYAMEIYTKLSSQSGFRLILADDSDKIIAMRE